MIKKILWQDCVFYVHELAQTDQWYSLEEDLKNWSDFFGTEIPTNDQSSTTAGESSNGPRGGRDLENGPCGSRSAACQALTVEEPSYQKYWCGPSALEKLLMGHGEEEALAKTLQMYLVEGEALLRAAQL